MRLVKFSELKQAHRMQQVDHCVGLIEAVHQRHCWLQETNEALEHCWSTADLMARAAWAAGQQTTSHLAEVVGRQPQETTASTGTPSGH
jgi:hypothetical protein